MFVLFASTLILYNHILDATKVIEEYGIKYKTDQFSLANMYKLFGLIFLMEESRNESIKYFDKALKQFKELKSIHGQAATYYLKSLALRIHDYEDEYNNVNALKDSSKMQEKAMLYYKLLKHKEGFLTC